MSVILHMCIKHKDPVTTCKWQRGFEIGVFLMVLYAILATLPKCFLTQLISPEKMSISMHLPFRPVSAEMKLES
uniref:Auxin response factor n=1 Tax=Rhizophora mucronata TaxID=61149 RepID=A0A2P2R1Y4_RHIMU